MTKIYNFTIAAPHGRDGSEGKSTALIRIPAIRNPSLQKQGKISEIGRL